MTASRPEAAFQTLTKRAMAVKEIRMKRTQRTGTEMSALRQPTPKTNIRSPAR